MLGKHFDDLERSGSGCSFGCTCQACKHDEKLESNNERTAKYKSDEQYGYTYKPEESANV